MNILRVKKLYGLLFVFLWLIIMAGCAAGPAIHRPAAVPEMRPGMLKGYLDPKTNFGSSAVLVPPPPGEGSTALALDEEYSKRCLALHNTPRWKQAAIDAKLKFPEAANVFSCALGVPITEKETPYLYMLLRRTLTDAGFSTYGAKRKYNRKRPFMVNNQPMCTPHAKAKLENNGSYPSGHTATGWAWALILAEITPERANAILARGRAFGESRNVCNVHWHSDVIEGRFMGAATVARLHADPLFCSDLEAAKAEVTALRAKGAKPAVNCEEEAAAISIQP
ncbi:MAG: phosphatase PAP2 family protein [Deltaproteobacteria bacterium]|nr:phosphatase PAP2 family protein [Deltaproteobacteria bacterium]